MANFRIADDGVQIDVDQADHRWEVVPQGTQFLIRLHVNGNHDRVKTFGQFSTMAAAQSQILNTICAANVNGVFQQDAYNPNVRIKIK